MKSYLCQEIINQKYAKKSRKYCNKINLYDIVIAIGTHKENHFIMRG